MAADHNRELLLATRNPGKVLEFRRLLADIPFSIVSLEAKAIIQEVEETGATFEENARIKAESYSGLSGLLTLADDSGLEVDALGGLPGVQSARYGGQGLTDGDRVDLLLENLKDAPWEQRAARFRCVIAISGPSLETTTVEGTVEGVIQYKPKGTNGFGYDPIFYLPHLGLTTAELSMSDKNQLSHRGQAAAKAVAFLHKIPRSVEFHPR